MYTEREALESCQRWFEMWSPTAETLVGPAIHPMLEMLNNVLASTEAPKDNQEETQR